MTLWYNYPIIGLITTKGAKLNPNGVDITIPQQFYFENDLEIDDDGACELVTLVYVADEEDPIVVKASFESVISDVIEAYTEMGVDQYQQIYSLAHELSRNAERLRSTAQQMEDSFTVVSDLFDP